MNRKLFVPKDLAKALCEKGFNRPCDFAYDISGNGHIIMPTSILEDRGIPAPFYHDLLNYLGDKGFDVWTQTTLTVPNKYYCRCFNMRKNISLITNDHYSIEEALDEIIGLIVPKL